MSNSIVVFGARGFIGNLFCEYLLKNTNDKYKIIIPPDNIRPENYQDTRLFLSTLPEKPHSILAFIGRTSGPGCNTIDYLEQSRDKLLINIRDNMTAPLHLARLADELDIHFMYLGTGCIYTYKDDKKIFTEDDKPNFFGSSYSIVKGITDQEIRMYKNVLQLRIRMPIVDFSHPRNFIDKIVSYAKIQSIPNSMTVLPDMFPIMEKMIDMKTTGTFNMTNPGVIDHDWILKRYKEIVNPALRDWELVTESSDLNLKAERSNNHLDTTKLEEYCSRHSIALVNIHESILRALDKTRIRIE
jgi:nucleoside-diphosphate-sugar epimerase